jgi:hypothetical protein
MAKKSAQLRHSNSEDLHRRSKFFEEEVIQRAIFKEKYRRAAVGG